MFDTNIIAQNNGKHKTDSRLQELADAIHELLEEWELHVDDPDTDPAPKPRTVRCPCTTPTPHKHGDANPSLSISLFLPDGANPEKKDAWGLYVRCLAGHGHDHHVLADEAGDAILAAFGEWKGISLETLKRARVQVDINEKNRVSVRFLYRDGSVHVRRLPKAWTWEKGKNSNEKLYDWLEDPTQEDCILVEGESDTLVLADAGFNVIGRTNVDALMSADKKFVELSRKYKRIYISVEDDQESNPELQNKLQTLQQKSAGAEIRAIHWANIGVKDPSELRVGLSDQNRFIQTVMTAMQNAERVVVQPKPSKSNRSLVPTGSLSQQLQQLFHKYAYSPNLNEIARRLVRSGLTDDFRFICINRRELEGYLRVWDEERKLWAETNEALHIDWVRDSVREKLSLCQPNSDEESRVLKELSSILGVERTITLAFKEAVQDIYTDEHAFILSREYIPCQNVLLRVEESGEIIVQELDRSYPITWHLNTVYDPTADAPLWREHLLKVCNEDPELVREILRLSGLAISGYRSRYIYWLHGGGRNGKTTTIGVISALLGPRMAVSLPANAFAARKEGDAEPYLWGARHARLIVVNETPDRADLDIEKLKALTDDNADTNRAIRGVFMNLPEEFIWKPQFSLIFTSNRKPVLPNKTDQAFYDRLRLLPFGYRFNESEMRPNYSAALLQEAPGILNSLIWGLVDYLRHPQWMSKTAYIAVQERRMEQDVVYAWLRDKCVVTHNRRDMVAKDDLYRDFMQWGEDYSLADEWNGKERRFTDQLKQILLGLGINNPYDRHGYIEGKRGVFYGLRFKTPQDPDETPKHVGRDAVVDMVEAWMRGETELQTIEYEPDWTAMDAQGVDTVSGGGHGLTARSHDRTIFSDKSKKFQNSNSNWNEQEFPNLSENGSRSCDRAINHVHLDKPCPPIDAVERFIHECCDVGLDYAVPFSELYDEYKKWCHQAEVEPDTETALGAALTELGFGKERRGKHRILYRTGLRLKPDRSPISIDPDALKRTVDALQSVDMDERTKRLLCGIVTRWEEEYVIYEDSAQEKLSRFVADFRNHSLNEISDMVAQQLLLAWFVSVRGCEHTGENGDMVIHGARLRDQSDPQPDGGGQGDMVPRWTRFRMDTMVLRTIRPNHVHLPPIHIYVSNPMIQTRRQSWNSASKNQNRNPVRSGTVLNHWKHWTTPSQLPTTFNPLRSDYL
jgi:P4 family phage/plasmid primase-like protien